MPHRLVAAPLLWLLLALSPQEGQAQQAAPSFRQLDSTSLALYRAGRWEALAALGRRHEGGHWAWWHHRVGVAAARAGRHEQAIDHLLRALDLNGADTVAAATLAWSLAMMGRRDDWGALAPRLSPAARRQGDVRPTWLEAVFAEGMGRLSSLPAEAPPQSLATIGLVQRPVWRWRLVHALSLLRQPGYGRPFSQQDYYLRADFRPRFGWRLTLAPHLLWFAGVPASPTDSVSPGLLQQRALSITAAGAWQRGPFGVQLWGMRATVAQQSDTLRSRNAVWQAGLSLQASHAWCGHRLRLTVEPQWHRLDTTARHPIRLQLDGWSADGRWYAALEWRNQAGALFFGESLGYVFNNSAWPARQRWSVQVQRFLGRRHALWVLAQTDGRQGNAGTFRYFNLIFGVSKTL